MGRKFIPSDAIRPEETGPDDVSSCLGSDRLGSPSNQTAGRPIFLNGPP